MTSPPAPGGSASDPEAAAPRNDLDAEIARLLLVVPARSGARRSAPSCHPAAQSGEPGRSPARLTGCLVAVRPRAAAKVRVRHPGTLALPVTVPPRPVPERHMSAAVPASECQQLPGWRGSLPENQRRERFGFPFFCARVGAAAQHEPDKGWVDVGHQQAGQAVPRPAWRRRGPAAGARSRARRCASCARA